jgi:hypothetical protein
MAVTLNGDNTKSQGSRLLDLVRDWQEADQDWSKDCAIVSQYYSGKLMESEDDQDTLGLVDHSNYLVGRNGLVKAKEETLAAILNPQRLLWFTLKDYDGTPDEKLAQERKFTKVIDDYLRKQDPRFLVEIEKMIDRHIAHGDAILMFPPDGDDWRPFSAKILTDSDAPQNPHDDNFQRWCVYSDLQIGDALTAISEEQEGWTPDAKKFIQDIWERRYDAVTATDGPKATYISTFDDMYSLVEHVSPEEWANQGSIGQNLCEFYNSRFRCFYVYVKDFSDPSAGVPVDFYIVARFQPRSSDVDRVPPSGDPLLFARKAAYPDVGNAIVDFVLDCNLGVDSPTWGTIKGLGHVNYNSDRWTNLLLSSMVNGAVDKNTPLLEVADSADVKTLEKWVKDGYRANSLIPAGVQFVDKSKNGTSIGDSLNMIGYLQQQANENAVGFTGQSDPAAGELRVQSLARQNNDTRTASNRGVRFAQKLRTLCQEVGRRILAEMESSHFFGRTNDAMKKVREELKRQEVELEWFYPENVTTDYARLTGNGDPAARRASVDRMIQHIGLYPAEARNAVITEWIAETTDDWERAEKLMEHAEEVAPEQEALALRKAGDMMQLLVVIPVTKADVPERQLPKLIEVGDMLVGQARQAGQFESMTQYQGLVTIGQHAILLIQKLEERGQRDLAQSFQTEIQRISTEAQEPLNNMLQAQEAQQDPSLQLDQAKLQLQAAKEDREERTFQFKQLKDTAQQENKDRQQEFNEIIQGRRLMNEDDRLRLEQQKTAMDAQEAALRLTEDSNPPNGG